MGKYEDLEIIKRLKDNGDMTPEEFETEKQKILNRPDDEIKNGMATYASCSILGVCSLVFSFIGLINGNLLYISIVFGIIAVVLGIVSSKKLKAKKENNKMVLTGISTGILGIIVSLAIIGMIIYSVAKIYMNNTTSDTVNNSVVTTNTNTNAEQQ